MPFTDKPVLAHEVTTGLLPVAASVQNADGRWRLWFHPAAVVVWISLSADHASPKKPVPTNVIHLNSDSVG